MRDTIKLFNRDLNEDIFKDAMFLIITEGGGMGTPGEIFFYDKTGQTYRLNYIYGDIDLKRLHKVFPMLSKLDLSHNKLPKGWYHIFSEFGNHFLANEKIYGRLMNKIDPEDEYLFNDSYLITTEKVLKEYNSKIFFKLQNCLDKYGDKNFDQYLRAFPSLNRELNLFAAKHPEFKLDNYDDILKKNTISIQSGKISDIDISKLDDKCALALIKASIDQERFDKNILEEIFDNSIIKKCLDRLDEIDEINNINLKRISKIELINDSCAIQHTDVVVNAANRTLSKGSGICGAIFNLAGDELIKECKEFKRPLKDGEVAITSSYNMDNTKAIIHAVGPNFQFKPTAFDKLFNAYYNSLEELKNHKFHSIAFPLISAGIYGGKLQNPVAESTKQCCLAYKKFRNDYPKYFIDVKLCAYSLEEMKKAQEEFSKHF